jgi:hypothetical protein
MNLMLILLSMLSSMGFLYYWGKGGAGADEE